MNLPGKRLWRCESWSRMHPDLSLSLFLLIIQGDLSRHSTSLSLSLSTIPVLWAVMWTDGGGQLCVSQGFGPFCPIMTNAIQIIAICRQVRKLSQDS